MPFLSFLCFFAVGRNSSALLSKSDEKRHFFILLDLKGESIQSFIVSSHFFFSIWPLLIFSSTCNELPEPRDWDCSWQTELMNYFSKGSQNSNQKRISLTCGCFENKMQECYLTFYLEITANPQEMAQKTKTKQKNTQSGRQADRHGRRTGFIWDKDLRGATGSEVPEQQLCKRVCL